VSQAVSYLEGTGEETVHDCGCRDSGDDLSRYDARCTGRRHRANEEKPKCDLKRVSRCQSE
jgi:hypothetical protein